MAKIIDCSIGFNEIDLFAIRVAELQDVVDHFVIVEANKTHSGVTKPPLFADFQSQNLHDRGSVAHYLIEDMPDIYSDSSSNRFILEVFQRNCIMRALAKLQPNDDDIILISDVDEIPKSSVVKTIPDLLDSARIVIFEQILLRFFANNISNIHYNRWPWLGTVACRYGLLKIILPQTARVGDQISPRAACVAWGYDRELYPYEKRVHDAGWHFTSMGGLEAFSEKMSAVSEGSEAPRSTYAASPRGLHNTQSFRKNNKGVLENFLLQYCPEIETVSIDNRENLAALKLPDFLISNLRKMNHLFYFSECID